MSRPSRDQGAGVAGFTLLEVLVAFAIAGIGLAALLQGGTAALGNASIAAASIEATRRAQSRLAMVGAVSPLLSGETTGDDGDGFHWRVLVAPVLVRATDSGDRSQGTTPGTTQAGTQPARRPPAVFLVEASVGWRAGRRTRDVKLTTLRLALPPTSSDE